MNTRKRGNKTDDAVNTQRTASKVPRTKKTTHTEMELSHANEHKIDTRNETTNAEENELATSSADLADDNLTQLIPNMCTVDGLTEIADATENILREADVLIAEIAEFRRDLNQSLNDSGSDETIIIPGTTDAEHQNESSSAATASTSTHETAATSANSNRTRNTMDDSVMIIDDPNTSIVRPITRDDDEDVIFVTESRREFRTIATIDLCETPDNSFTQPQQSNQSVTQSLPCKPPEKLNPGTTKCPICLEIFGLDEILSTFCGHLFCDPCIKNVIKTRKKCPMCNRNLKQSQVHRIFLDT